MKLKLYYRKNLKMSPGKLAAQCVHAAVGAQYSGGLHVCVLSATDKKFDELRANAAHIVQDRGLTEVEPGTETVLATYEP